MLFLLRTAAPDLGAEGEGILFRVSVHHTGTDCCVDLQCDYEIDLETAVDNTHRINREIQSGNFLVDQVDVLRIVGQHSGVFGGQITADTGRDEILLGVFALLLLAALVFITLALALVFVFLCLVNELLTDFIQDARSLLLRIALRLITFRTTVVCDIVIDHLGPVLVRIRVRVVLGLGGNGNTEAGVRTGLQRCCHIQTRGQTEPVLMTDDSYGRVDQEFLLEHDRRLDLQNACVHDRDLDCEGYSDLTADTLLALKMIEIRSEEGRNFNVTDLHLLGAVRKHAKIIERDVSILGLDCHISDFLGMLKAVDIRFLP